MSNQTSVISHIDTEGNFSDISEFDPEVCGNLTHSYLKVKVMTRDR